MCKYTVVSADWSTAWQRRTLDFWWAASCLGILAVHEWGFILSVQYWWVRTWIKGPVPYVQYKEYLDLLQHLQYKKRLKELWLLSFGFFDAFLSHHLLLSNSCRDPMQQYPNFIRKKGAFSVIRNDMIWWYTNIWFSFWGDYFLIFKNIFRRDSIVLNLHACCFYQFENSNPGDHLSLNNIGRAARPVFVSHL